MSWCSGRRQTPAQAGVRCSLVALVSILLTHPEPAAPRPAAAGSSQHGRAGVCRQRLIPAGLSECHSRRPCWNDLRVDLAIVAFPKAGTSTLEYMLDGVDAVACAPLRLSAENPLHTRAAGSAAVEPAVASRCAETFAFGLFDSDRAFFRGGDREACTRPTQRIIRLQRAINESIRATRSRLGCRAPSRGHQDKDTGCRSPLVVIKQPRLVLANAQLDRLATIPAVRAIACVREPIAWIVSFRNYRVRQQFFPAPNAKVLRTPASGCPAGHAPSFPPSLTDIALGCVWVGDVDRRTARFAPPLRELVRRVGAPRVFLLALETWSTGSTGDRATSAVSVMRALTAWLGLPPLSERSAGVVQHRFAAMGHAYSQRMPKPPADGWRSRVSKVTGGLRVNVSLVRSQAWCTDVTSAVRAEARHVLGPWLDELLELGAELPHAMVDALVQASSPPPPTNSSSSLSTSTSRRHSHRQAAAYSMSSSSVSSALLTCPDDDDTSSDTATQELHNSRG